MAARLTKSFFLNPTLKIARDLIGKTIVRNAGGAVLKGVINETEAYFGFDDPASHAARGKTPRNSLMYDTFGVCYVYFCYGNHWLFNITTEKKDYPAAVLIRSVIPYKGIDSIIKNRGKTLEKVSSSAIKKLTDGPAKFTQGFLIDKSFNGRPLSGRELYIENTDFKFQKILTTGRIGIKQGVHLPYRFLAHGLCL